MMSMSIASHAHAGNPGGRFNDNLVEMDPGWGIELTERDGTPGHDCPRRHHRDVQNVADNGKPEYATQVLEGLFNIGPLHPGASASYTFSRSGEYFCYDCTDQQSTGKFVVRGAG